MSNDNQQECESFQINGFHKFTLTLKFLQNKSFLIGPYNQRDFRRLWQNGSRSLCEGEEEGPFGAEEIRVAFNKSGSMYHCRIVRKKK